MAHCTAWRVLNGMRSEISVPATQFGSYADHADRYRAKALDIRRMTRKISRREARQSLLDVAETYDVLAQAMDSLEWRVEGHRPL
jgi:hypothetical protein